MNTIGHHIRLLVDGTISLRVVKKLGRPSTNRMNGINYFDMKEVAERLKMKSVDAAARWCLSKNISIMLLGNKRVVSEFEFRSVYETPLIDMLKEKHGEEWLDYYEVYKNGDARRYHELKQGDTKPAQRQSGFNADDFLNDLGYGKSKNS